MGSDCGFAFCQLHGVKGVAWLQPVTCNEAAVGTQSSSLVITTSKAAEREAGIAATGVAGVGCSRAFAGDRSGCGLRAPRRGRPLSPL